MGEDLRKANRNFKEFWNKTILKIILKKAEEKKESLTDKQTKELKGIFYMAYLNGWIKGSENVQLEK